jgi:hypothetical protein
MAKPKFLSLHRDVELSKRIQDFFEQEEYKLYQHKFLKSTGYAPQPLYVDFEKIGQLENPDFTEETIGDDYLVFARLCFNLKDKPGDDGCYAHLSIHPETGKVYLLEPSGDPELIGKNLDAFLGRLNPKADKAGGGKGERRLS